jgi:hypothetical protein
MQEIKLNVKKLTRSFPYTLPVNTTESTNIEGKTGGGGGEHITVCWKKH